MVDIINRCFEKDTPIGKIRFIASSNATDTTVIGKSKEIFNLIRDISDLDLIKTSSRDTYINDYRPGSEKLDYIESIVDDIYNVILQGYFYDVLQVNKRNKFDNAKKVISSYFEYAKKQDVISKRREYYLRILNILQSLGKGNKSLLPNTVTIIFNELVEARLENDSYSITKIAEEIIPLNAECIDWHQYTLKIKNGLEFFKDTCKFDQYRQCNHILALLLKEEQLEYGQNVARSYFWEADEYEKIPNVSQHLIVDLYKKGLKVLENLQIDSDEILEKKRQLTTIQKRAAKQLADFGIKPTTSVQKQDISIPEELNLFQAVYWLISPLILPKSFSVDVLNNEKLSFAYKYSTSSMEDSSGNTIDTSADNEKNIFRIAKKLRDNYCYSVIIPAYEEFSENYSISETEVYQLVSYSKFIPSDRLDLYAHALYQGFCGNFAAAVYILIPQIENGFRHILESNDVIIRKLTEEQQKTMSLESYFEKLREILNEDVLFDLRVLLIEGFGDNMRHDISHGLYSTAKIFNTPGIYLWWIALKIAIDYDSLLLKYPEF